MAVDKRNYYDETIERIEPDIAAIDPGAYHASASVSLRRIADTLDRAVKIFSVIAYGALMLAAVAVVRGH